ncbi:MAG: MBOAT family protein, partial [Cyanobacteria bacterium P01_H01_bin.15]
MLFNSYIFIFLFLPISFGVYFLLATRQWLRAAQIWLLAASLFFYGFWKPPYLILMVVSIVFNHQMGAAIANAELGSKKAKTLLWVGIGANLAAIAHYKYAGFVASSLNVILQTSWNVGDIFLPLAISFYTFTQIAYLVDAYRGEVKGNNYDLVTYALFVAFFPQLIAGPILRHDELIPQLRDWQNYTFNHTNIGQGLSLFILGLGKKVLIA